MTPQLIAATAKVRATADALARAYNYEHELEDLRAAIKADAIKRIMLRDNCAATPAEKVVETDPDYFTHREKQRASVVERFKADAEYWAAKVEATQASLITPDVFALSEEIDDLVQVNRSRERAAVEAGELAATRLFEIESLRDANADLVQANRELADIVEADNRALLDANRSLLRQRNEAQQERNIALDRNAVLLQTNYTLSEKLAAANGTIEGLNEHMSNMVAPERE